MITYEESLDYVKWQIVFALEEECTEQERNMFMNIYGRHCNNSIQKAVFRLEENRLKLVYNLVYRTVKGHD